MVRAWYVPTSNCSDSVNGTGTHTQEHLIPKFEKAAFCTDKVPIPEEGSHHTVCFRIFKFCFQSKANGIRNKTKGQK
jgi:hypothetical protein